MTLWIPRVGYWGVLTEDAPAGQKIVKVTDGSKFVAGVAVLIEDDSDNEVASIMGNRLTMKYDIVPRLHCRGAWRSLSQA